MGKRSNFDRIERDYYPTPIEAVIPLVPHLPPRSTFIEPCAGDGRLVSHLTGFGHTCLLSSDIEPQHESVVRACYTDPITIRPDFIITNPPWDRKILHPMIERFVQIAPTWLLFDADWVHTKQSARFGHLLSAIVSVGRVKWFPDSKMTGKDNCAWHLFSTNSEGCRFFGR